MRKIQTILHTSTFIAKLNLKDLPSRPTTFIQTSKERRAGFVRNLRMSIFQILMPQRKFEQVKLTETNGKNETVLQVQKFQQQTGNFGNS